ncbi:MAG: hypothetical protein HC799_10925 [Limnothrix sp. RL_2_0]|nr:hypothetical protein [Limnothrix sp. RL_2_0]
MSRNVLNALSQSIILSGKYQVTRRYWGKFEHDQIQFHGPRATKQFCFVVTGKLAKKDSNTVFIGQMYLSNGDRYQLFAAVVIICSFLAVLLRWGAIFISPIFIAFIYAMTQWHFQFYVKEITQVLTDLMIGKELKSNFHSANQI